MTKPDQLPPIFFEHHPNPMLIFDVETQQILNVNQRAVDTYGYSRSEFLNLSIREIRPEEDIPILQEELNKIDSDDTLYDRGIFRHLTRDGEILHVQIAAQSMDLEGRKARIVHIHDITETVNLKNSYKNTLNELNHHIDENPLAMVQFDNNFRFIKWSERAGERFGYTKEEVIGKTPFELQLFKADEVELIKDRILKIASGKNANDRFNTVAEAKNGEQFYVRIHASSLRTGNDELKSVLAFIENIENQMRMELLFKNTERMGMIGGWEFNPHTEDIYWSDQVYRIHEVPVGKQVSLEEALQYYPREDREKIEHGLQNALEEQDSYDFEVRLETNKGNIKWVRTMGRPVIRNGEVLKISGTFQDITEHKMKEQEIADSAREKEVLLAEIHHRVKNNLAIISGLLEMKVMDLEDQQMVNILSQSQMRIQSMAMIHEALYQSEDFTNIEFSTFLENLIATIRDAHGTDEVDLQIQLESIDNLPLDVNQAIPCGLLVNELVTNSMKHAFEGRSEGSIRVNLGYNRDNQRITLMVEDNGKGLPDSFLNQESPSMGTTLIKQLVKQLNGDLKIKNSNGAQVVIQFDKENRSGPSSGHRFIRKEKQYSE